MHPVDKGKEGSSNVIMEALACGVPVITTVHAGYHGEFLEHDVNVLFCKRDIQDIRAGITLLKNDPDLKAALGRAGRQFAQEHHDIEHVARRYREVIERVKGRHHEEEKALPTQKPSRLFAFIAYAPLASNYDLGNEYNQFMERLDDNDWAIFLDHDACFVHDEWYEQIAGIIRDNPDAGLFTCVTNRINNRFQHIDGYEDEHRIDVHHELALKLKSTSPWALRDVTFGKSISGVVMVLSKKVWKKTGFPQGFLGVDNKIHHKVRCAFHPVHIMRGVYVYHFYRADNDLSHLVRKLPQSPASPPGETSLPVVKTCVVHDCDPSKKLAVYADYMTLLKSGEWAVFIDHDVLLTTKTWYHQVSAILGGDKSGNLYVAHNKAPERNNLDKTFCQLG